jgi:hypothetical protein
MATPLDATRRYIHAGETRLYFVAAIDDVQDPTRDELDLGTDLTAEVAVVVGWHVRARLADTQGLTSDFATTMPLTLEVDDSRVVFYAGLDGTEDVRTLLPRGTVGHLVLLHGGDVEDNAMDVWPVEVAAVGRPVEVGGEPARIDVQFAITADPGLDLSVPPEAT